MPFITQNLRNVIDKFGLNGVLDEGWAITPGDRCYPYYKEMVRKWKENPRWTTAHEIFKGMIVECPQDLDDIIAANLAWQVFFNIHVMEYEQKKRLENGDI